MVRLPWVPQQDLQVGRPALVAHGAYVALLDFQVFDRRRAIVWPRYIAWVPRPPCCAVCDHPSQLFSLQLVLLAEMVDDPVRAVLAGRHCRFALQAYAHLVLRVESNPLLCLASLLFSSLLFFDLLLV
ncbi:hypothetical protein H9L39_18460 [Fusarium oxysporum f. sp. albedinis]|nr:hypothetical protein H9L39_18460 [Fusarium oxysporum f. sp. albedinis]